jgi:hypothetical protein
MTISPQAWDKGVKLSPPEPDYEREIRCIGPLPVVVHSYEEAKTLLLLGYTPLQKITEAVQ